MTSELRGPLFLGTDARESQQRERRETSSLHDGNIKKLNLKVQINEENHIRFEANVVALNNKISA